MRSRGLKPAARLANPRPAEDGKPTGFLGSRGLKPAARLGGVRALVVASALLVGLMGGGCGAEESGAGNGPDVIERTAEADGISVTLKAWPASPTLDEHLAVELVVEPTAEVAAVDPQYADKLAEGDRQYQLRVVRSEHGREALPGGKVRERWRYALEFFVAGDVELPGATVIYRVSKDDPDAAAPEGDDAGESVSTEGIVVEVRPSPEKELTEAELREVRRLDPVELPTVWERWWWVWAGLAFVVVAGAVWLIQRRRRERTVDIPPLPAHEWAREEIRRLVTERLIERGEVQTFHYRISAIVRGYIERRFGLSAPEMTTEEFLAAAARDERIGRYTEELRPFLSACDLVKYARHVPGREESEGMLKTACDFVERTKERVVEYEQRAEVSGARTS